MLQALRAVLQAERYRDRHRPAQRRLITLLAKPFEQYIAAQRYANGAVGRTALCLLDMQQYCLWVVRLAAVITDGQAVRLAPAAAKVHQAHAKAGGIESVHEAGCVM